jgi:hypothetical protein
MESLMSCSSSIMMDVPLRRVFALVAVPGIGELLVLSGAVLTELDLFWVVLAGAIV